MFNKEKYGLPIDKFVEGLLGHLNEGYIFAFEQYFAYRLLDIRFDMVLAGVIQYKVHIFVETNE